VAERPDLKPVTGDDADKPPERQPNGVLVERTFNAGGWGVNLIPVGDMRRTELLSVLRMACAAAEREVAGG
jgi:hypothetical protein